MDFDKNAIERCDYGVVKEGIDFNEKIIEKYKKFFNYYLYAPIVGAVILAIFVFALGIVLTVAEDTAVFLLISFFGAPIVGVSFYFIFTLASSYVILHIFYLEKIANKNESVEETVTQDDVLPEI